MATVPDPQSREQISEGDPITWGELATETAQRLAASPDPGVADRPDWHARQIVLRACGAEPSEWPEIAAQNATVRGVAALDRMTGRRLEGEPLQYVLGEWSFRYLELFIDRRVLIPRPETEIVTSVALDELRRIAPDRAPVTAVDLGTGSGAIGLSLVNEHDGVDMWLTDVSDDALQVARANLAGLGRAASRVRVTLGSWFEALPEELRGHIGVVVSNPPYIADHEELPTEVGEWEPRQALYSGPTGTEHLELLIEQAPLWLQRQGSLVLEMAPHQTASMAAMAKQHFSHVEIRRDLAERERTLLARRPTAGWG